MNSLKSGDLVRIYLDPYTDTNLEGLAVLDRQTWASFDGSDQWIVTFYDEPSFGVERTLHFRNRVNGDHPKKAKGF